MPARRPCCSGMTTAAARRMLKPVLQIAAISAVTLATRASFADHYRVPTGSMEPTVLVDDHIFVSKIAYGLRVPLTDTWIATYGAPARGDVVVLEADEPVVLLKRVAAVGGDLVEVKDGHVRIDGCSVSEPNVKVEPGESGPDFGPVRVPAGKLLVLGDNRGNSRDGRTFGWVDRTRVLGRAVAVIGRDGKPAFTRL
jgi:signal peptidase I